MNRRYIHYLRELFGLVLLLFKLFIPARKAKILSIYFHDPSPSLFERIINYLNANNYRIISLKQFNDIIDKKQLNEKIAVITIDDGWQNNIKLLDVVRKHNIPITIFVTTSAVEQGNFWFEYVGKNKKQNSLSIKKEMLRLFKLDENEFNSEIIKLKSSLRLLIRSALTEKEVIELSKEPFVTIGSHTVSHPSLPNNSLNAQINELINSKSYLEKITNQEINYFSYPFGHCSDQLKSLAKECGYMLCFTTGTNHIDLNHIDKLSIPRRCVNDNAGYYEALSKIFGIWYKVKK